MQPRYIVTTKQAVETLDMANICCGRRRCAVVTVFDDGSLVTVDGDQRIEYTPEQAEALRQLLTKIK